MDSYINNDFENNTQEDMLNSTLDSKEIEDRQDTFEDSHLENSAVSLDKDGNASWNDVNEEGYNEQYDEKYNDQNDDQNSALDESHNEHYQDDNQLENSENPEGVSTFADEADYPEIDSDEDNNLYNNENVFKEEAEDLSEVQYPNYPLGNDNEYDLNVDDAEYHNEYNDNSFNDSFNDDGFIDTSTHRESLDAQNLNQSLDTPLEMSEEEKLRQRYLKVYTLAWEKSQQLLQQKQNAEDSLANYFRISKKGQENKDKTSSSNAEERYKKLLETHTTKRIELAKTKSKNNAQLRELLIKVQNKQSAAAKLQTSYLEYKMGSAAQAENSRTGKPIPQARIAELTQQHIKKDEEVRSIRTKYIYLSNQKDTLEKSIKQKEFSDGLHLIDFEQYKMENATLNEKIEEKNESLQKSTLKARSTVHILTHVNEKLQFIQSEDIEMKQRLADLEKQLSVNKKLLAGLKDTRDHYKDQNIRMRDANPLIGNDQLLIDYESRKQELEDLRYKLKHLRNLHSENERKTNKTKATINNLVESMETGEQSRIFPNIHSQRAH